MGPLEYKIVTALPLENIIELTGAPVANVHPGDAISVDCTRADGPKPETKPEASSLLLRLADRCGDVRHHGDRRQCAHRVLIVLSADHFRVWMGARRHGRRLLFRLCGIGCRQSVDRAHDGSLRAARGDGARCLADGRWLAARAADDAALASLSHHRRDGWCGQRVPRLFRSIAVSAELVHSPP